MCPALKSYLSIKYCAKTEGSLVKPHRAEECNVFSWAVNKRFINQIVHTRWHTIPCLLLLCFIVVIILVLRQHPNLDSIFLMQSRPHPIALGWVCRGSAHTQNQSSSGQRWPISLELKAGVACFSELDFSPSVMPHRVTKPHLWRVLFFLLVCFRGTFSHCESCSSASKKMTGPSYIPAVTVDSSRSNMGWDGRVLLWEDTL